MYKDVSTEEYKNYLGLYNEYKVDGLLLHGTWNVAQEVKLLEESLKEHSIDYELKKFENSDFLNIGYELNIQNQIIWFFVVYGGALTSEFTHLACLFGSKKNILIGSCGGLKKGASSGDIILPVKSRSDGSSCYMYDRNINDYQLSNLELRTKLRLELEKHYMTYEGPTVTCQGMLGETEQDVKKWSKQGYLGVEMESSTVFAVSNQFNVPSAAVLRCGDNLIQNETVHSKSFQLNRPARLEQKRLLNKIAIKELIST